MSTVSVWCPRCGQRLEAYATAETVECQSVWLHVTFGIDTVEHSCPVREVTDAR